MYNLRESQKSAKEVPTQQPKLYEVFKSSQMAKQSGEDDDKNLQKFVQLFACQQLQQEEVQQLAWNGVPPCIRAKVWKYLLKYITGNRSQSTAVMQRKRKDYFKLVQTYLPVVDLQKIDCETNMKTAKIIQVDVKRTLPQAKIIRHDRVQQLLTRSLFIWHVKHPASGYVQGIGDLVIPFFLTFLNEYIPLNLKEVDKMVNVDAVDEDTWNHIEADLYWCTSKMLDAVTSNYVRGFGGVKESFKIFEDLLQQIDEDLHKYLMKKQVDLFCMTFRELTTFLLRMFTPKVGIRLFDTYIACGDDYPNFTLYLLVAIMVKFSDQLQKLGFDDIMKFMQKPPTKQWTQADLEVIIAEAYAYRMHYTYRFKDVPIN